MLQIYTKPDNGYASISTINLSFAGYGEDNLPSSGIGIIPEGVDKLQWSAVYNLSDRTGRIWTHRDSGNAWDFEVD